MATPLQPQPATLPETNSMSLDGERIQYLAEAFGALADATRLRVVHLLLTRGEMCVCEFMPLLDLTQSNVSFHLKALKYAGLIVSRKEGRWMLYRLNREAFERLVAELGNAFDLSIYPEEREPAARSETIRRRLACQQEQDSPLRRITTGQEGNDNANE